MEPARTMTRVLHRPVAPARRDRFCRALLRRDDVVAVHHEAGSVVVVFLDDGVPRPARDRSLRRLARVTRFPLDDVLW